MKITIKLIACLIIICLLGASSNKQNIYKVSARNFNLSKTESIAGFKLYFNDGGVRTFSNAPDGWKIVLNNWDEDDQLHWTGSMKGQSGHGAANIGLGEFLKIFVIMDVTEPDFNLKLDIYVEDHEKYCKRTIKLIKKQLLITPFQERHL